MARTIHLASPLTSDACAARLAEAIDDAAGPWMLGSRPVIGCVSGPSVWLRKRIRYRNGFQTLLVGTFNDGDNEPRFRGRTRLQRRTQVLLVFWFGGVLLAGIFSIVLVARGGNPGGLLLAPLMLALGGGVVGLGRWLARDEERFLIAFLADAINAQKDPIK
uniref:Uncharacterized protein n=1 Tax=Schlesneria paludicola TaxID=360056 RepID=A0A7C2NW02_9PLAN